MADVLTPAQRSYCMSRIRCKDTQPEMIVRKLVHALGYRYRLHVRNMPGRPDLVFSSRRKVIFVHGCFWHRHRCKYGQVTPKTRKNFWRTKLEKNKERDGRNRRALRRNGWHVLVVWECQTKCAERLIDRVVNFLDSTSR